MSKSSSVYVLGLDYEVKDVIHWTDAVVHILKGSMSPFKVHPTMRVRSAGGEVDIARPEIVRLNYWVQVPRIRKISPETKASRHQILRRDGFTCAYCGAYCGGSTGSAHRGSVDHIIPESRCKKQGYPHNGWTFGNLVACCLPCNSKKADRTPEEAGMKLLWQPHATDSPYATVQAEVWRILESGGGYANEGYTEPILK